MFIELFPKGGNNPDVHQFMKRYTVWHTPTLGCLTIKGIK